MKKITEKVKQLILKDIEDGIVPKEVKSFDDLQDHVDANMYFIESGFKLSTKNFIESITTLNECIDDIHKWLQSRNCNLKKTEDFYSFTFKIMSYGRTADIQIIYLKKHSNKWTVNLYKDDFLTCSSTKEFDTITKKEAKEDMINLLFRQYTK